MNNLKFYNWITLCLLLLMSGLGSAQISLSKEPLVVGEEVEVTLSEPSESLVIIYRPNSQVVKRDTVILDSAARQFIWTPKHAGVVKLQSGNLTTNVSVRFAGTSYSGVFIMLIAAFILFGGAALAFRILFRKVDDGEEVDLDIEHRPDT